ncbi:MAG TPA: YihY/virulence factor BrkB family protein [Polyangia bacterium]|jgi:membrane protein|nr:YihY/virulence factor BrkB family protein [Polyangia bacterium]
MRLSPLKLSKKIGGLLKSAGVEWSNDNAPRLAASLSYYTIFSLAPLLLMVIAVASLALGATAAQGKIVAQLSGLLGADAAKAIQTMLEKASRHGGGVVATVVGFVTLIVGATGVMIELQDALNTVWKVVAKPGRGIRGIIRDRLLSFGIVLGFGFLLLVSLVVSAAVALLDGWLGGLVRGWVVVGYLLSYGLSLGLVALVLAAIFKILPDVKIAWRDVWVGAFVTSGLFHLGKFGISLYIGKASVASSFGAAGSLAVLLVWIYYSSLIVLYGAEFTRVYANEYGTRVVADDNAVAVPDTPLARAAMEKKLKNGEVPISSAQLARPEPVANRR